MIKVNFAHIVISMIFILFVMALTYLAAVAADGNQAILSIVAIVGPSIGAFGGGWIGAAYPWFRT